MYFRKFGLFALILSLLLVSCSPDQIIPSTPTGLSPQAVYTAAAETAQAKMTEMAAVTPTPLPETPTLTPQLEATTAAPTEPVSQTQDLAASPTVIGTDIAAFVLDVTAPDGTSYSPGEGFTKTWRLQNAGTSTWTTSYELAFYSGAQMGGASSTPLSKDVPPGDTIDVSVGLTAPNDSGTYTGYWVLRNPAGKTFGVEPSGTQPFYVLITVSSGSSGSAAATVTPGGDLVSNVSLTVDTADFEGDCPHTFNFLGQFTLSEAATVTYQLEAETGFSLDLPAPTTSPLDAGTHTLNYTLEFSDTVSGWARLHITAPKNAASSQVEFNLTCN